MVQNLVVTRVEPTCCYQKAKKPIKNVKISKSSVKTLTPVNSQCSANKAVPYRKEKKPEEENIKRNEIEETKAEEAKPKKVAVITAKDIRTKRREERLAREKQAAEERERFVKEAAERKAAERAEIIKQAKILILYRKPMCRRINQGLIASECLRELDAQLKFRETIKNADKEAEMAYVNSMRADVAKYEEEMKQKTEERLNKQRNYATDLKKQIEENEKATRTKEKEKFEADKQDQINIAKHLQDIKEHEAQELFNKKQKLNQFFNDSFEEKKQLYLQLKHEEEFDDRAIEIYQKAKAQIQKKHKMMALKEKQEEERKAEIIAEKFRTFVKSPRDLEEKIFKKAVEEQEMQHKEKVKIRKEHEARLRKELQDFRSEAIAAKSKQLQEDKDLKIWEMMQRFKKAEHDKEAEVEERKREQNNKMKYADTLRKYITEKEAEREQQKITEDESKMTKEIIEKENQKVLNYAEEVLNESKGIRPLYPILKAVEECKKEMGLMPLKEREEIITDIKPKRRRRVPHVCTKFVPESKICYLK